MTTAAPPATPTTSTASKVLALAAAEFRLLVRNRTVLISAGVLPLALGLWLAWSIADPAEPVTQVLVTVFQLGVVLSFVVYYAVVATLVARRNSRVLKRYRSCGVNDPALLAGSVAVPVALAAVFLALFALANPLLGLSLPPNPLALVVAAVGGIALAVVTGALTTVFTRNIEQASGTTLPGLLLLMLAPAAALLPLVFDEPLLRLVLLVPGAGVGWFGLLSAGGAGWTEGGPLALVLAAVGVVGWPLLFGFLARRYFRWDPRH